MIDTSLQRGSTTLDLLVRLSYLLRAKEKTSHRIIDRRTH